MKEYNKNFAIITVNNASTTLPEGYTKDPLSQLIHNDLNETAKARPAILEEWNKRYSTKSEPKS